MKKGTVAAVIALTLAACSPDPAVDAVNLQRTFIAQELHAEKEAITKVGVLEARDRAEHVKVISPDETHIQSWYHTKIGGPVDYQMIVRRTDPAGNKYRVACFKTAAEGNCFTPW